MTFFVLIKDRYSDYYLKIERIYLDERTERFKVSRNNSNNFIVVENNRPFFRNKGLKHRKIDWKLADGKVTNMSMYEQLIDALMQALE